MTLDFAAYALLVVHTVRRGQETLIASRKVHEMETAPSMAPLNDKTLKNTISFIRQAKVVNAVKVIQQNSIKKGFDKITMEEIDEDDRLCRNPCCLIT